MNLNELTPEEIRGLLNVQKVLNALLDKINSVEAQISQNREQIDTLTKSINDLSNKVLSIEINTTNELKQIKNDNISTNQKLFNIDKQLTSYSKQLSGIEEELSKIKVDEEKEDTKKNTTTNKSVKDLKKVKK